MQSGISVSKRKEEERKERKKFLMDIEWGAKLLPGMGPNQQVNSQCRIPLVTPILLIQSSQKVLWPLPCHQVESPLNSTMQITVFLLVDPQKSAFICSLGRLTTSITHTCLSLPSIPIQSSHLHPLLNYA